MVGCEVALQLSHLGYAVDVVEMAPLLAPEGIYTERLHTLHIIEHDDQGYSACLDYVSRDSRRRHHGGGDGVSKKINADAIILCAGMMGTERTCRHV